MVSYVNLLILSLGGSPAPAIFSIKRQHPRQVVFFVSEQSAALIDEVLAAAAFDGKVTLIVVPDPEDLPHCFRLAEELVDGIGTSQRPTVVVDLTGGTKVMVAALAMAAYGKIEQFSYVGGSVRTKEGLGLVGEGHETLKTFFITSSPEKR